MNRAPPVPYDANLTVRHPSVAWPIGISLLALAIAAAVFAATAEAQPVQPTATVYVHVCAADGKCKTVTIPVPACLKGGQAQLAAMLAGSGLTIKAFHCEVGEAA